MRSGSEVLGALLLAFALPALAPGAGKLWKTPPTPPQALTDTEVYLVSYDPSATPAVTGPVVNVSNSPGYDNQPSFLPDGSAVLFTSQRDGAQTDIYRYDLSSRAVTPLTRTTEGEYSPLVTPDGRSFSAVRVEADGTQRLWRFDLDGSNPRLVLESIEPVGYHVWIDDTRLGLFILGQDSEPATLQVASTTTQAADVMASHIGRSLLMRPGTATMSFISSPPGETRVVRSFDPRTRAIETLVAAVEGSQDCAWDPRSGRLLMARGATIFGWTPGTSGWEEVGDLSASGITAITRMAFGPDTGSGPLRLAIVAESLAR